MKKFELLTTDTKDLFGRKLFRIRALRDFGNVKAGELGGYVEKEGNLSHDGNAWICDNAEISGNAEIYGDAEIYENAKISGNADYLCFKGLGSSNRNTTFFKCKDGSIGAKCGCSSGSLSEFVEKVRKTHGDNKYAREYLKAVEIVKIHFDLEESE